MVSTQARGLFATRPNPDMMCGQRVGRGCAWLIRVQDVISARTTLTPAHLRGPRASEGKGVVDFFPEQFSELRGDVDLPDVGNMVSDIHPTGGETGSPGAPTTAKGGRLIVHNRVYDSAGNDGAC